MDKITAIILSLIIAGIATYVGGNAFFESSFPLAMKLRTAQLTMQVYWVAFFVIGGLSFLALSWAPIIKSRLSRSSR
jgi:hypothetical protein